MRSLAGRLVVVTGASSGIGAEIAVQAGERGATVVLLARRRDRLDDVAARVEAAGGTAHVLAADLSDPDAVQRAGEQILTIGVPEVLINNAGAGDWRYIDETPADEVVSTMALPYFASFWMTRAVIDPMRRRGSGQIVMLNSPAWMMGWSGAIGYSCARAAQHQFAECLREDLRPDGIVVTEVTLGEVSSDYFTVQAGSHERLPTIAKHLFGVMTPATAAGHVLGAVERQRSRVHRPLLLGVVYQLDRWVPFLVRPLVRMTQHRRSAPSATG